MHSCGAEGHPTFLPQFVGHPTFTPLLLNAASGSDEFASGQAGWVVVSRLECAMYITVLAPWTWNGITQSVVQWSILEIPVAVYSVACFRGVPLPARVGPLCRLPGTSDGPEVHEALFKGWSSLTVTRKISSILLRHVLHASVISIWSVLTF